jgi:ABC-type glycerol-3-phosphate transport system substrate-binding protein
MSIGSISNLMFQRVNSGSSQRKIIMLPGGKAGLSVQGFAVSSGTQYPEQAYKLAAFLTTRGELANRSAISPARKSLVGKQAAGGQGGGPGGGPGGPRRNITPEQQALIDQALANGIPYAEMRYMDYLQAALNKMKTDKLDAKGALQAVDAQAVQDQAAALDKKQSNVVAVATPVPVTALAPGKVAIKFGLSSFTSPLPNQDKWNKIIQDFVASDPQVGRIDLDTRPGFGGQISGFTDNYDCFYLSYNAVPNTNLGLLISLDSFMAADKSFDKADVIGNVMAQLQRDNKTWAFPIVITPTILDYNSDQFNKAGVPAPTSGWTIDAFKDAMKALKLSPQDPPPFIASNTAGAHLLILMAAYGGLPIDYRTNPVTINFTDPATVDAIRQVLDLAKQGYIKYDALSNFAFDNRVDRTADVYTDNLNSFNARQRTADPSKADPYKPTSYPKGKFTGVSYNIGTMYVSAKSQNPEACYRWISELSKHPDLFSAMPARRSLISDPAVVASQGKDVTALYNQIDELMKDANVVAFPSVGGAGGAGITGFLMQHWLYQAFDSYVLKDGDLDTALKEAEGYAKGFQGCVANIPPFDPSTQNQRNYNQQFADCASKVDPNLKGLFGGGN